MTENWPNIAKTTMNKSDLVDEVAKKLGTDRRQASAIVENVIDTIVRAVHRGDSVTITGFGVFEQRRRAARVARNPRTGETIRVKPTSIPAFRPGAQFKAVVAGAQRLPAEGPAVKRGVGVGRAKKAAKKSAAKKAVSKKSAAKKVVPKKAVPKKAVPKKSAAKKAVSKKAVSKKAVSKKAVSKKAVSKKAVSKKASARKAPLKKGRR